MGGGFYWGHGEEEGGHVLGLKVGGGRLGGAGRDLAAWPADQVCSGGGGRCGAAVFSFWAWLDRGPAMCEVVWRKVYSGFSTVFLLLLLLAVGVGFPAACFGR